MILMSSCVAEVYCESIILLLVVVVFVWLVLCGGDIGKVGYGSIPVYVVEDLRIPEYESAVHRSRDGRSNHLEVGRSCESIIRHIHTNKILSDIKIVCKLGMCVFVFLCFNQSLG